MFLTRSTLLCGALGLAVALAPLAYGQSFPTRVVRIVVPFPAGGTADLLPRVIGEKISAKWGQPVIIENKTGAGGNIGAEQVYRSDPDGYTLLASPPGPLAINHNLYKALRFDPTQWVPVTVIATVPNVLAARTGLQADSVGAVIAMARANPGKLTYASQGNGSTSHLTANLFENMAGVKMLHIPYRGTAPALNDLMGGQVDIFFDNLGSSLQQHEAGRIKILAVASPKRAGSLPTVPTIAEAALPGFQSVTWFAVVAPPGTPEAIAQQINAAMAEAIQHPDVQQRFRAVGADPVGNARAEAGAFIKEETERWQKVIEAANMPRI